jgi:hypothetical protein
MNTLFSDVEAAKLHTFEAIVKAYRNEVLTNTEEKHPLVKDVLLAVVQLLTPLSELNSQIREMNKVVEVEEPEEPRAA